MQACKAECAVFHKELSFVLRARSIAAASYLLSCKELSPQWDYSYAKQC